MNQTLDTLKSRRSIRKFKPDMLPRETIDAIIEAGLYAPSGMNTQNTVIVAITNPEIRDRLARANAAVMGAERDPFYGAPVVLVVLAKSDVNTHVYDGSVTAENILLAAHSLGLGACWIHRAKEVFESDEGKEILRELGIVGDYEGIGNCILGYADGPLPEARPRKENYIIKAE